jgi:signal transduction histidine kinase
VRTPSTSRWRPAWRPWRRWRPAADCAAAAAVAFEQFALAVPNNELAPVRAGLPTWHLALFAAAMALPVLVLRRWPVAAWAAMLAGTAAMVADGIPAAIGPALPLAPAVAVLAMRLPAARSLLTLAATVAALGCEAVASHLLGQVWNSAAGANVALLLTLAWCAAFGLRQRRERAADARAQAVERAVTAERLRIARELHDVIAHGMGVIAVQSAWGSHVAAGRPDQARQALEAIQDTSRSALADLRGMLGLLRAAGQEGEAPGLAPAPGLANLEALLARTGHAGLHVDLRILGRQRDLAPGVDLAAYRIVQEALTNVLKHAGPGTCHVTLDYRDEDLRIDVTDHGAAAHAPRPAAGGTGHGLIGMRERAALYGGELHAAPTTDRGFRVSARLPLTPAAA